MNVYIRQPYAVSTLRSSYLIEHDVNVQVPRWQNIFVLKHKKSLTQTKRGFCQSKCHRHTLHFAYIYPHLNDSTVFFQIKLRISRKTYSISAVKRLVFEEKRVSMGNLRAALEADFAEDEPLRQLLLNRAPKYGNDEPEADRMAHEVTRWWAEEAAGCSTPLTGKRYRGGYLSWNYGIAYAPSTASTPDGRMRGTYLSNGVAAVPGMDHRGPTAAACSVGHLGLEVIPNGSSHTMSLSPALLRDETQLMKLAAFLRGYCQHGGSALQVNMVDVDTLRAAQKDPETYRNLLVRVTGYNAYFTNLGREMQEEIIAREAHQL